MGPADETHDPDTAIRAGYAGASGLVGYHYYPDNFAIMANSGM
jgi:hypothetical protein